MLLRRRHRALKLPTKNEGQTIEQTQVGGEAKKENPAKTKRTRKPSTK